MVAVKTMTGDVGPVRQRERERGRGVHLSVTARVCYSVKNASPEGELGGLRVGLLGLPDGLGLILFFFIFKTFSFFSELNSCFYFQ